MNYGYWGGIASLVIAVNGNNNMVDAQRIPDRAEAALQDRLENHHIVVHVEPC